MATDALIQLNYSDGVFLFCFYKKTDCYPKEFIKVLAECLDYADIYTKQKGRINWTNCAAYIFNYLYNREEWAINNIKLWHQTNTGKGSYIYDVVIQPDNDKYADINIPMAQAVKIKIMHSHDGSIVFEDYVYNLLEHKV